MATSGNTIAYGHDLELRNLQTDQDHLQFLRLFLSTTPEDFNTDFCSLYGVVHAITSSRAAAIWVAYKDGTPRGFLIHDDENRIHTMFTLACTPETKVPSLFKEMLLIMAKNVPRVVPAEGPSFLSRKMYNEDMIKWFTGSAKHARLNWTVVKFE